MEIWYYALNGAQQGPVTQATLVQLISSGQLPVDSLVWREGLTDWIPARNVPELASASAVHLYPTVQPVIGYGVAPSAYMQPYGVNLYYGGFWIRVGAAIIDWLIVGLPFVIINQALGLNGAYTFSIHLQPMAPAVAGMSGIFGCFQFVLMWLYYSLLECSSKMGTLGKQACGLKVTDEFGQRMSFGRATGRYFAKYVSLITLCVGYMLAGWTPKKQALHDMIASTFVIRK